MSDNDDLLGDDHDDLGDQSLADYNLGNEEEEQLLADDYDTGASQNVPPSVGYGDQSGINSNDYTVHGMEYGGQADSYIASDAECVVPNIIVEVPNIPSIPKPVPKTPTYAPYEPPTYEVDSAVVPPAIPAAPIESPQIVPSEILVASPNDPIDVGAPRERFTSERPAGSQRMPQIRDIPDSLDKVFVPRGGFGPRNRTTWRNPQYQARYNHPYRRHNAQRGNFQPRPSFPPPQQQPRQSPQKLDHHRPSMDPAEMNPDMPPMQPLRPPFRPEKGAMVGSFGLEDGPNRGPCRPDDGPNRGPFRPDDVPDRGPFRPDDGPNRGPFRPDDGPNRAPFRPDDVPNRGPFRLDEGPNMPPFRPDDGPSRGPFRSDEGPHRGLFRQDDGPNRGPFRPDDGPNMGPFRPMEGPNMPFRPDERPTMPFQPNEGPNMPFRPNDGPNMPFRPNEGPNMPFRPNEGPNMPFRPDEGPQRQFLPEDPKLRPFRTAAPFGPERPMFAPMQRFPNQGFGPRTPFQYPQQFNRFGPPREVGPNQHQLPQVSIRQQLPGQPLEQCREPEVRMLPVPLPGHLPQGGLSGLGGLAGKKVLINPHFKGNFQPPPVEGLTYIPTRIIKSPPLSPTLESKFGPTNLDDAAERFIAEQRNALARAANRKPPQRRSPQRFIENTTIEIENELALGPPPLSPPSSCAPQPPPPGVRTEDDDLLRRQEEFINANRAGLRRRMRSPTPPRRSPSPRRSLSPRRPRASPPRYGPLDEESEYRRRVREQESIRERVLRAKEVRRRKNAVALTQMLQDRQRELRDKDKEIEARAAATKQAGPPPTAPERERKPDSTTKAVPERERSPQRERPGRVERVERVERPERVEKLERAEINSTENLTPPREAKVEAKLPAKHASETTLNPPPSPLRDLTPPLPVAPKPVEAESDDDLDLILGDIDGILSEDEEDTGRFKEKLTKPEATKPKLATDLRSKLPPKTAEATRPPKQRIIFTDDREDKKRREEKSPPPKKSSVTSSTNTSNNGKIDKVDKKQAKAKHEIKNASSKFRPRIMFDAIEKKAENEPEPKADEARKTQPFSRRVVLQRKIPAKPDKLDKSVFARIEIKNDPTKPNPGIFSRAVRTAIGSDRRIVAMKLNEPKVEFVSDGSDEELPSEESGDVAMVTNLPHGMTDTRLKTLAGSDVQSVSLDKEERSALVAFKSTSAAETFRRKFNNKMVAASRLTVTLR